MHEELGTKWAASSLIITFILHAAPSNLSCLTFHHHIEAIMHHIGHYSISYLNQARYCTPLWYWTLNIDSNGQGYLGREDYKKLTNSRPVQEHDAMKGKLE